MLRLRQPIIKGIDGKPIKLNSREAYMANLLQREVNLRFKNSLGYEVNITTLTSISKKISEQKFFEVPPADYIPIRVSQGTWGSNILTYRSFNLAGAFSEGVINSGGNNGRLASANAGVDSVTVPIINWGKEIGWTIFELEQAAKSGNWDIVASLERARKVNWDIGIQQTAFYGLPGLNGIGGSVLGLLNQGQQITVNTTVITKPIKNMTPAELKVFTAQVVEAYRANTNRTAWPDRFVIPESDYNGLASQSSPEFPIKSVLELLEEAFAIITRNPGFKILPLAYADASYHTEVESIVGKQVYALYKYDEESLRMDIPLDYTNTLANSVNNFSFQNVGYGQFTGVGIYRPQELMYFQYNA